MRKQGRLLRYNYFILPLAAFLLYVIHRFLKTCVSDMQLPCYAIITKYIYR